jgi:peptidoglycan hydrolase-like protein with peptidoglycan-binding domain
LRTAWHKRCRRLAAAVAAAVPCLAALAPASAAGQDPHAHGALSGEASGAVAPSAEAPSTEVGSVRISAVSCVPAAQCSPDPHQVVEHGTLLFEGEGLSAGMAVAFPRTPGGNITSSSPVAHLRQEGGGLALTVPLRARSGYITVLLGEGQHSDFAGPIEVLPRVPNSSAPEGSSPLEGQGMWIWHVSSSDGGQIAAIVAQAHAAGVSTLFIKSSDGSNKWFSQFSPELVAQLHADGLKVCAWQYVYGTHPAAEAALGARAVADGADCLVIDAEAQYEGRYAAAQRYLADLRAKVGAAYPLGLTSLAFVSQHLAFPYSVFLGPGGAQFNLPQMYWKDIGVSVNSVFAITYAANDIYGRPIFPLGQTFGRVSAAEVLHFRRDALQYGATGTSFWDFEETRSSGWDALAEPLAQLSSGAPLSSSTTASGGGGNLSSDTPASASSSVSGVGAVSTHVHAVAYPELGLGAKGDPVLWMQEHLARAIPAQETTGRFNTATTRNLIAFQSAHAIAPSGRTNAATWAALLALSPVAVDWTGSPPRAEAASMPRTGANAHSGVGSASPTSPTSASETP